MVILWRVLVPVAVMGSFVLFCIFFGLWYGRKHHQRALKEEATAVEEERRRREPAVNGEVSNFSHLPFGAPSGTTASGHSRVIEARYHERMTGNLIVGVPLDDVLQATQYPPQRLDGETQPSNNRQSSYHQPVGHEVSVAVADAPQPRHSSRNHTHNTNVSASINERPSTSVGAFDLPRVLASESSNDSSSSRYVVRRNSVSAAQANKKKPHGVAVDDVHEPDPHEESTVPPLHEQLVAEGRLMLLLSPTTAAQVARQGPDSSGLVPVTDAAAVHAARSCHTRLATAPPDRSSLTFHFADVVANANGPAGSTRSGERAQDTRRDGQEASHDVLRQRRVEHTLWVRRPSVDVYGQSVSYLANGSAPM